MKRLMVSIVFFSFLLSACTLDENAADLYKKELPLEAKVFLPEEFSGGKETIEVILTQYRKKVDEPDFVHFEIWKQDGSVHYPMEEAESLGNGTYSVTKDFESDGLYYVKVHAGSSGSIISPQMQFIVGELSKEELDFLQKGLKTESPVKEPHH
ncbi:FixH family protein [Bacillus sp. SG-1]|uniref:FixH family protein n=1 Tax=Bacillus sp. SG-1 TaxID=161544 RepID=UPI0003081447|nr:FixH family protein [Bacillus sp. SG-1]